MVVGKTLWCGALRGLAFLLCVVAGMSASGQQESEVAAKRVCDTAGIPTGDDDEAGSCDTGESRDAMTSASNTELTHNVSEAGAKKLPIVHLELVSDTM